MKPTTIKSNKNITRISVDISQLPDHEIAW